MGLRWSANGGTQQSYSLPEKGKSSISFGQAAGRNLVGNFLTSNWDGTTYRTDGIVWKAIYSKKLIVYDISAYR